MANSDKDFPARGQRVCPAECAGWLSSSWRKVVHNPARILRGLIKAGDTVVDIGCGPGFFSLPMAEAVGEDGLVIAVDLQPAMLEKLKMRAQEAGLVSRIRLHQCTAATIGLQANADFVLAFYVLHEVPDQPNLLAEVHEILQDGGRFLLVEPWGYVSAAEYRHSVAAAAAAGLRPVSRIRVPFSRATLFERI